MTAVSLGPPEKFLDLLHGVCENNWQKAGQGTPRPFNPRPAPACDPATLQYNMIPSTPPEPPRQWWLSRGVYVHLVCLICLYFRCCFILFLSFFTFLFLIEQKIFRGLHSLRSLQALRVGVLICVKGLLALFAPRLPGQRVAHRLNGVPSVVITNAFYAGPFGGTPRPLLALRATVRLWDDGPIGVSHGLLGPGRAAQ